MNCHDASGIQYIDFESRTIFSGLRFDVQYFLFNNYGHSIINCNNRTPCKERGDLYKDNINTYRWNKRNTYKIR